MRIARERPEAPILGLTPNRATSRMLALVWGVHPVLTEDARDVEQMVEQASRIASTEGFAREGSPLVVVAGMPFGTPGSTNLLRIARAAVADTVRVREALPAEWHAAF
jgi:pyruvate kinase